MGPDMRTLSILSLISVLLIQSGCQSTGGFSLWPNSFPLLKQTKEVAAEVPVGMCLARELNQEPVLNYFVEPGDRILIEPVKLDSELDLIGDQLVQVDGSIDLGEFGRLRVAGFTVEGIEAAISDHIQQATEKYELVNVQLIETNAALFYVLGEVGSPGAYELAGRELVLDGLLRAGGLTSKASPCNIVLVRPTGPCDCRVVLPVCYRQITQLGDTTTNYQLQPGDRIVVASRTCCEELAFWRQSKPCKSCACNQCPECRPCSVNYANRFMRWLSPFPLPPLVDDSAATEKETASPEEVTMPESVSAPKAPVPKSAEGSTLEPNLPDEEYYLPPIKPKK